MYTNRMFFALIGLALATVIFFTFRVAISTTAVARADRSYDQVEVARTNRQDAHVQLNSAYDLVEAVRLGRSVVGADQSYSQVEALRIERGVSMADRSYDPIEDLRAVRGTR